MNKEQREIFRNKLDMLYEFMKNGERRELTAKDIYAPRIFHFFDIYKIYDRLQIIHFRGSAAKPALIPIIERLTYPQSNGRKNIKFKRSRKRELIPNYMRLIPECSQVDINGLFKELDLMIMEFL